MKRILTALVGIPLALAALFGLPPGWFFLLLLLVLGAGAYEFVQSVRPTMPGAPLGLVLPLVAVASFLFAQGFAPDLDVVRRGNSLMAVGFLLAVGVASLVLLRRTPIDQALPAMGTLAFAVPYFAVPIASLYHLKAVDPWIVFLLMGIVWLGDSAAYYVGSAIGRHKLAPVVSPNKSWEGAAASLAFALVMTLVWSYVRLGRIDVLVLLVCLVTAIAAQLGDLAESMIKRGVGVKDSGTLLPGHGGLWDRMDAMLFAAPALEVGMWLVGMDRFLP